MTLGFLERISERHARVLGGSAPERRFGWDDWAQAQSFMFGGINYPMYGSSSYSDVEDVENHFVSYVQSAYKSNGIVFSCMLARALVFTEARFQWQRMTGGRPGDLFGTAELEPLERPWPTGTTGELLSRQLQDVDLAGNAYVVREGKRLRRLRPDWVSIILTAPPSEAVESDVAGYLYRPGGLNGGTEGRLYLPDEVAHWVPPGLTDPEAQYRGMSWITPIIREIQADKATTLHKLKFFENGATPQFVVSLDASVPPETARRFKAMLEEQHAGVANAYQRLYVGGGANVIPVGKDLHQLDFSKTQGAGEVRIANAARIPAVLAGLSEGLTGSSLNEGNFKAARRSFSDGFLRPMWRSVSAANENLLRVPTDARLWYDDRDVAFLRDDAAEEAKIVQTELAAIREGTDSGFDPDAVVNAVATRDVRQLVGKHSGLFSVQLQPRRSAEAELEPPVEPEEGDDA